LTLIDIPALDRTIEPALQKLLDEKAKPVGSLGRIEELSVAIGLIRGELKPALGKARSVIFAGDHGLTEEGVSSHPPEVTAAMVQNFISGGATISAFTRIADAELNVVDAGVKFPVTPGPGYIHATPPSAKASTLRARQLPMELTFWLPVKWGSATRPRPV